MSSNTAQSAAQSAKRVQNEFGADLWVKDQSKNYRHRTGGRGMFAGLQDAKHYSVDSGWAKRAPEQQQGFFSWLYDSVWTTEPQGSGWRQMRAWAMMMMATAAAAVERAESKTTLPRYGAPVLEPVRVPISMQSSSTMAALAMRMRQNAQRRTMATMAAPSAFPFLAPLSQSARRSHRSYPRPRRLPARVIIPPSPETRLRLKFPFPNVMTKALPLTIVSLALAAATASWVVSIVLHPISRLQFSSSSTPASLAERRFTSTIPPPHQIYDQAMYNDPSFGSLMVKESGRTRHLALGPVACFFLPDVGEERTVLCDRYDYSFWVDGIAEWMFFYCV